MWDKTANRYRYWERPDKLKPAILEAVKTAAMKTESGPIAD